MNKDLTRLGHMLDCAKAVLSFAKGRENISFIEDRPFRSAALRELEIIGKAASKVSEKTQERFSHLPWKKFVETRNRLVHVYFDVDYNEVWETIQEYVPPFYKELERIIKSLETESD